MAEQTSSQLFAAHPDSIAAVIVEPVAAAAFCRRLADKGVIQSVVLSTCNRCEVFFVGAATSRGLDA